MAWVLLLKFFCLLHFDCRFSPARSGHTRLLRWTFTSHIWHFIRASSFPRRTHLLTLSLVRTLSWAVVHSNRNRVGAYRVIKCRWPSMERMYHGNQKNTMLWSRLPPLHSTKLTYNRSLNTIALRIAFSHADKHPSTHYLLVWPYFPYLTQSTPKLICLSASLVDKQVSWLGSVWQIRSKHLWGCMRPSIAVR